MPTRFTHNTAKMTTNMSMNQEARREKLSVDKVCVHGDRITDGTYVGYI
ncbi:hypothetical protein VCRA2128O347_150075 [Vibrio crassostreae]|nr:hypothetical protein VCRA2128O347_150075 [Vibrio crassostreae]